MKSLCITGNTQYGVDQFANLASQAGAQEALPAPRTPPVSMGDWHQAVLAQYPQGVDASQNSLGRVWEQLAGDIYLANHLQALWFWADTRSASLLEFWRDFDLNTRFVLVYTDPAAALERALTEGQISDFQLDDFLAEWQQTTRQMLRFHLRHSTHSVLLSCEAAGQAAECVGLLNDRLSLNGLLQLPVEESASAEPSTPEWLPSYLQPEATQNEEQQHLAPASLSRHLIAQYLEEHPQVLALHEEVMASIDVVGNSVPASVAPLAPREALGCFVKEIGEQHDTVCSLEGQVATLQGELSEANARIVELSKTEAQLKETTEENELLLEQLHIVQEELEKAFEWKSRAEAETAKAKKLEGELKAANEKANSLNAQLKKSGDDLKAATDKLHTEGKQKVAALENQLKDVNEENELLLEQLHLVQEELERYYLNLKQAEADKLQVQETVTALEKRLARVFARHPDYWDCEQLAVVPLAAENGAELAHWTFKGLETAGRYIPELQIKTILRNGKAGILILRDGEGDAPLERWPASFAKEKELPCIVAEGGPLSGSNLALSSLSPADWEILKKVTIFLATRLENARAGDLPPGIDNRRLMRGLAEFALALKNWPALMRFKQVEISPVTNIPNYSALSIKLKGVDIGGESFDQLSFRLASVDTEPGQFGQNPRLEFPESCREVLKTWFAETSDDRGPRLELRFAKPNAFDVNVWRRLNAHDQSLVAGLLSIMPVQLAALEQTADASPGRPAGDWQEVSTWMTRTLAGYVNPRRQARVA